ncbi:MAG: type II secretion system F family protein [Mollicutes bacterium]|nr:type II secretion system F family protein [Mollicutes bacterium]
MKQKNSILYRIYRNHDIEKLEQKINMLGSNVKFDAVRFIYTRFITTLMLFLIVLYIIDLGYIFAPFIAIAYYYLYYYVKIEAPLRKRIKKLDHEALYFFEILTLTLESGRNLENSLEVTCFNVDSELSNEFKKALFELKFGKSLIEALEDLKKRIPSETINNIILNITQTNLFGNSIIETMYNQIDFLRDKQVLSIKEQINKIPNKVSIVSVLFVVPLILIMILGPIVINFLK